MNLIQKVGGIEKAKLIVGDYLATTNTHVSNDGGFWTNENNRLEDHIRNQLHNLICIEDLRTAIANHGTDNLSHFTDTCIDIRNHISPNTKVVER